MFGGSFTLFTFIWVDACVLRIAWVHLEDQQFRRLTRCVVLGARSACQPALLQASWEPTKLRENLRSLMVALGNAKPEEMKGAYFRVCLAVSVRAQSSRLTPRLWLLAARDTFVIGWPRRAAGHDHFEPGLTAVHAC